MFAGNNQNNPKLIVAYLGDIADDGTYPVCYLPKKFVLLGAKILDKLGVAASETDYLVLTLKNGSTELAAIDTSETAIAALAATDLELTSEAQELAAGSTISLSYAETVDMGDPLLTKAQVQLYGYWL